MDDDVLVRVENVSKRFCRSLKRSLWYGLQDLGSELGGRRHGGGKGLPQSSADVQLRPEEFWAVKDVSFELRRGECLGLIGRNGAGKTTLLRMLNGLIKPDTGRIKSRGKTGALIALGAGFNNILTGRENIAINSSILGLTRKEAEHKLEEIVEFAELGGFIDSPVQTYSSGMQVRLGFSIAAALNPNILLLDEVLAVGDDSFHAKCWNRLGELQRNGCSFILVSHQINNIIRLCSHALYLKDGSQAGNSEKLSSIKAYRDDTLSSMQTRISAGAQPRGSGRLRISGVRIIKAQTRTQADKELSPIDSAGHTIEVCIVNSVPSKMIYVLEVKITDGVGIISQFSNEDYGVELSTTGVATKTVNISIPPLYLNGHTAALSITLWSRDRSELLDWMKDIYIEHIGSPSIDGRSYLPTEWTQSVPVIQASEV